MSTQAAIFVLDMLADYKMPQKTLKGVMKKSDQLVDDASWWNIKWNK